MTFHLMRYRYRWHYLVAVLIPPMTGNDNRNDCGNFFSNASNTHLVRNHVWVASQ